MMCPPELQERDSNRSNRDQVRFRSAAVDVNGLSVHMMVSDRELPPEAPLLVLVHGLGLSHRYMMPVASELAMDCRVYVPDLPGFGNSGHPEQVLDMMGLGDALADWMRTVGLARAAILGNSQACQVIGHLAVRHPDLVGRAILQGPTTPPEERSWFWQFVRWRQNGKYNPKSLDPICWDDYRRCGFLRVLRTFQHSLNDHLEDQAPHIRAPTLVVRGECDPICRSGWTRQLVDLLPDGHFVEIPRVAHTLVYTAPRELADVTRSFIPEHTGLLRWPAGQEPSPGLRYWSR
ncbi:alpha/beta hydrolase [Inquilinus limosus]|uniref:alpha/beta fold hydrolase n=1 Tax=Inquilinus limosus TaxID=171674 RepID=UPI003F13A8B4